MQMNNDHRGELFNYNLWFTSNMSVIWNFILEIKGNLRSALSILLHFTHAIKGFASDLDLKDKASFSISIKKYSYYCARQV